MPSDLQKDCCGARFMLNDVADALKGNFDHEAQQLEIKFTGREFLATFVAHCMKKFLARRVAGTSFQDVEALSAIIDPNPIDGERLARKVLDAAFKGFEEAKIQFENMSALIMPKIVRKLCKNPKFTAFLKPVRAERKYYLETRKLRGIDEDSLLCSLVNTADELYCVVKAIESPNGAGKLTEQLKTAHCGIQYCMDVKGSVLNNSWPVVYLVARN